MYIRIDMISLPYLIHVEINDFSFLFYLVGSRNNTPLSEDPFLTSRNTGRFTGRCNNNRKVSKEQTKTHHIWTRRKTGTRTEGCKICGMFSINTGLVFFQFFPDESGEFGKNMFYLAMNDIIVCFVNSVEWVQNHAYLWYSVLRSYMNFLFFIFW